MDPNAPLQAPPPGVIPNTESQVPGMIACATVSLTFMMIFLLARLYTKLFIIHALGWDDCKLVRLSGDDVPLTSSRFVRLWSCETPFQAITGLYLISASSDGCSSLHWCGSLEYVAASTDSPLDHDTDVHSASLRTRQTHVGHHTEYT